MFFVSICNRAKKSVKVQKGAIKSRIKSRIIFSAPLKQKTAPCMDASRGGRSTCMGLVYIFHRDTCIAEVREV